jgi:hypothetical protein
VHSVSHLSLSLSLGLQVHGGRALGIERLCVECAHMYTYDAEVWDLSIVQGPFSVAPCQALRHDSQLFHRCRAAAVSCLLRQLPLRQLPHLSPGLALQFKSESAVVRSVEQS